MPWQNTAALALPPALMKGTSSAEKDAGESDGAFCFWTLCLVVLTSLLGVTSSRNVDQDDVEK